MGDLQILGQMAYQCVTMCIPILQVLSPVLKRPPDAETTLTP